MVKKTLKLFKKQRCNSPTGESWYWTFLLEKKKNFSKRQPPDPTSSTESPSIAQNGFKTGFQQETAEKLQNHIVIFLSWLNLAGKTLRVCVAETKTTWYEAKHERPDVRFYGISSPIDQPTVHSDTILYRVFWVDIQRIASEMHKISSQNSRNLFLRVLRSLTMMHPLPTGWDGAIMVFPSPYL